MALSRPGRFLAVVLVLIVLGVGGVFVFAKLTGTRVPVLNDDPGLATNGDVPDECPLTGVRADVPYRPALAVKIENAPASRPQAGLEKADIVYEQPVEGGITRYIAVYQCQDAERLGPVRSVRLVDGDIVRQFAEGDSQPLFAHSGGIPEIVQMIPAAGLHDIGFDQEPGAYERDPNRDMPHNLYSSTAELYEAVADRGGVPPAIFTYDPREPSAAKPGTAIRLPFAEATSTDTDVHWTWDAAKKQYGRRHGDAPHTLETGAQITAKNVIVQFVQTRPTEFVDVTGSPVLEIGSIGQGRAIVFRDGKAIEGTWVRQFAEDVTVFKDARGREIDLAAGNTWVELFPVNLEGAFSFS